MLLFGNGLLKALPLLTLEEPTLETVVRSLFSNTVAFLSALLSKWAEN